ncbi:related to integral membrane protein [Fusarium torulosum]|uniref:Related to integral membrane protein n=1 Tax=Fusarium torulosum TaxID=33205 RepID=A0AAE8SME2_9HYPO|nr:related to integral membrane protein [Fusarium torulosum]
MSSTQRVITANNKSPLVQVLSLMFLVIAILSCLVRTGTKLYMIKTLRVDDILIIVATVLAACQTATIFNACEHGLGQHFEVLSTNDRDIFFKSQYATNTMLIASLLCCKLSGTMSLRIMAQKSQKWIIIICEAIVGIWGATALIVNFFQCQPPTPWLYGDNDKCINLKAFWTCYSTANIITDIIIVVVMAENVLKIQTSWSKKILVMSVFGSRIFVTPAIAAQIHYSNKAFASADHSFAIWPASIAIQLVQCLAILTVCLPNFKPFLDSLESGQIRVDDLRRQGKSSSNGYPTNKPGYAKYKTKTGQSNKSHAFVSSHEHGVSRTQRSEIHEMEDFGKKPRHDHETSWDGQSRSSHSSQKILIHQTWQVDIESTHDATPRQT